MTNPAGLELVWIEPNALLSTPVLSGFRYWDTLRAGRAWPRREELNPRHMTGLLNYMSLIRVVEDGKDFETRIVGDVMVQAFSVPVQHRKLSEIAEDSPRLGALAFPLFQRILAEGKPLAWRQHSGRDSTRVVFTDSEVVLLPLGDDSIDHILCFGVHHLSVGPVVARAELSMAQHPHS